jgi:hypothetical protein
MRSEGPQESVAKTALTNKTPATVAKTYGFALA